MPSELRQDCLEQREGAQSRQHREEQAAAEEADGERDRGGEGRDAEDVAAAVGLSPFHVMRLFKARTGMTVHQFVVHRRLEAARAALAAGAAPAEAAARFGFYDQSHFTGHFRRAFGTTPRRYADACR